MPAPVNTASPNAASCIRAEIRHHEESLGADGVARTAEYTDVLYRCKDQVWIERARDRSLAREASSGDEHERHELPPLYELAKFIEHRADGSVRLTLVDRREHLAVDLDASEFDSVQFDGDWEAASQLLRERTIAGMQPSDAAAPPGARWLERHSAGRTVRVLWSDQLALPLEVENSTDDRHFVDAIAVRVSAIDPNAAPWVDMDKFARRDISAFRD